MSTASSFFQVNYNHFNIEGGHDIGLGYWDCQRGAIWAVKSHFTASDSPALVSMPTGSGKTAVMMGIAFELRASKILIVTPSQIIREQIYQNFKSLELIRRIGVYSCVDDGGPRVKELVNKCRSKKEWEQLLNDYGVLVTTPLCVSPIVKDVVAPPKDMIDMVIFDEAHHIPAVTWNALKEALPKARKILLTATPFRRDRKRIKATRVYHYSIRRALQAGIYRQVEFVPLTTSIELVKRDKILCEETISKFSELSEIEGQAKVLIRTDRIEHAEALLKLYSQSALRVDVIHSKRSAHRNVKAINELRAGVLDGIVCVGMVNEGFDVPELRIAVLHAVPKSIPYTVQFIGRVSRSQKNQEGKSYLLADPDLVRGEVDEIYKYDSDWVELIPEIVDILSLSRRSVFEIDESEETPRIYTVRKGFSFSKQGISLRRDIDIVHEEQRDNGALMRIIVTRVEAHPNWARKTDLAFKSYDLHIYNFLEKYGLIFEFTSSDFISLFVRKELFHGDYQRLSGKRLCNVCADFGFGNYFMVGIRNVIGKSPSQAAYKMYLGSESQRAIRRVEGRSYAPGHALVRLLDGETRGVALDNSKVWAMARVPVETLNDWCVQICAMIKGAHVITGFPQIEFLAKPDVINKLEQRPIGVRENGLLEKMLLMWIEFSHKGKTVRRENIYPVFKIDKFDEITGIMRCELYFCDSCPEITLEFNAADGGGWKIVGDNSVNIQIEDASRIVFAGGVLDFLAEYPPVLFMPDGSAIVGNTKWEVTFRSSGVPESILYAKNWSKCEITKEVGKAATKDKINVLQATEAFLNEEFSGANIICDHGKGEIADYVVMGDRRGRPIIRFVHCKASKFKNVGLRVEDCYEVVGQAVKSLRWVMSRDLLKRLYDRISRRSATQNTKLLAIEQLKDTFQPAEWQYEIIIVQPGFDIAGLKSLKKSENLYQYLLALWDRVQDCNAELQIWGNLPEKAV
jgi:superfamily II DNA or RNA helicase